MKVNVLGTDYEIVFRHEYEDPKLKNAGGYCDYTVKRIVVEEPRNDIMNVEDLEVVKRRCIRHELIHAFAFESGLGHDSDWAMNEEMTDFFARQIPRMIEVMTVAQAMPPAKTCVDGANLAASTLDCR